MMTFTMKQYAEKNDIIEVIGDELDAGYITIFDQYPNTNWV